MALAARLLALTWLVSSGPALAQSLAPSTAELAFEPRAPAQPSGPTARAAFVSMKIERYGWKILLTDVAVIGAAVAASASDDLSDMSGAVLLGGYLAGGPIVHLAHGNRRGGLLSSGLRVGMPVAGAALGLASSDCAPGTWCELETAALGGVVGMLGACVIDAINLAEHQVPVETHRWRRGSGVAASPVVSAAGDRAFVGLAGSI